MAADLALARVLSLLLLFALLYFCADCVGVTEGNGSAPGFSEAGFSEGRVGDTLFAGVKAVDKSSKAQAATSASVSSIFREFHLAMRAYIAERLQVMPDLTATAVGTP